MSAPSNRSSTRIPASTRRTSAVLGAAIAVVLLVVSPAFAQQERPVAGPVDQLQVGIDLCMTIIDIDELNDTRDQLTAQGWTVADETTYGPAVHTLSATYMDTGRFYAEVTSYPTTFLAYCSYEVITGEGPGDMAAAAAANGLEGPIATDSGNAYGTWEMQLDGGVALFTALAEEGHFLLQMNWIESVPGG